MLLSDLGELGSRVLEAVKGLAVALCTAHGGYVVEATEGLCLAAFHDPVAAACWALDCVDNVKMQVGVTRKTRRNLVRRQENIPVRGQRGARCRQGAGGCRYTARAWPRRDGVFACTLAWWFRVGYALGGRV